MQDRPGGSSFIIGFLNRVRGWMRRTYNNVYNAVFGGGNQQMPQEEARQPRTLRERAFDLMSRVPVVSYFLGNRREQGDTGRASGNSGASRQQDRSGAAPNEGVFYIKLHNITLNLKVASQDEANKYHAQLENSLNTLRMLREDRRVQADDKYKRRWCEAVQALLNTANALGLEDIALYYLGHNVAFDTTPTAINELASALGNEHVQRLLLEHQVYKQCLMQPGVNSVALSLQELKRIFDKNEGIEEAIIQWFGDVAAIYHSNTASNSAPRIDPKEEPMVVTKVVRQFNVHKDIITKLSDKDQETRMVLVLHLLYCDNKALYKAEHIAIDYVIKILRVVGLVENAPFSHLKNHVSSVQDMLNSAKAENVAKVAELMNPVLNSVFNCLEYLPDRTSMLQILMNATLDDIKRTANSIADGNGIANFGNKIADLFKSSYNMRFKNMDAAGRINNLCKIVNIARTDKLLLLCKKNNNLLTAVLGLSTDEIQGLETALKKLSEHLSEQHEEIMDSMRKIQHYKCNFLRLFIKIMDNINENTEHDRRLLQFYKECTNSPSNIDTTRLLELLPEQLDVLVNYYLANISGDQNKDIKSDFFKNYTIWRLIFAADKHKAEIKELYPVLCSVINKISDLNYIQQSLITTLANAINEDKGLTRMQRLFCNIDCELLKTLKDPKEYKPIYVGFGATRMEEAPRLQRPEGIPDAFWEIYMAENQVEALKTVLGKLKSTGQVEQADPANLQDREATVEEAAAVGPKQGAGVEAAANMPAPEANRAPQGNTGAVPADQQPSGPRSRHSSGALVGQAGSMVKK